MSGSADGEVAIVAFGKLKQEVRIQETYIFLSFTSGIQNCCYLVLLGVCTVRLGIQELRINGLGTTIRQFGVKIKIHVFLNDSRKDL